MTLAYFVEGDELWVVEAETGQLRWRGQPDGYPVWRVLPIPGADDCLVLLDPAARSGYGLRNLIRCRPDGSVVWRAEQPGREHDRYNWAEWMDEGLQGWSDSGFRVLLDAETGRILAEEFTKGM